MCSWDSWAQRNVSFFVHFCAKICTHVHWWQPCLIPPVLQFFWNNLQLTIGLGRFFKIWIEFKIHFPQYREQIYLQIFCANTLPPPTTALLIPVKEPEKRQEEKLPQVKWETIKMRLLVFIYWSQDSCWDMIIFFNV